MHSNRKRQEKPHQESETLRRLRPLIGLIARQIAAEQMRPRQDAGLAGGTDMAAADPARLKRIVANRVGKRRSGSTSLSKTPSIRPPTDAN